MAINDDDLLPDLDHLASIVDEVDGQAEGFALPESRARAEEDQQGVPAGHRGGEREDLTRRKQPDDGGNGVGKPDVITRGLADIAVSHGPAHNACEYYVDSLNSARGKSFYRLQVLDPLLNRGGAYGRESGLPKRRVDVIAQVTFIGVDSGGFVESRFHPDRCVFAKRSPPDSRVNPVASCGIGGPLSVERLRACLGVAPALLGKADDDWWRTSFTRPLFLLITAQKWEKP